MRKEAVEQEQCLRFIAKMEVNGNGNWNPLNRSEGALEPTRTSERLNSVKCSVSLEKVGLDTPFAKLEGSNNIVMLHTARYAPHPMMIQGYGAGAGVTAAGVFADVLDIVNV